MHTRFQALRSHSMSKTDRLGYAVQGITCIVCVALAGYAAFGQGNWSKASFWMLVAIFLQAELRAIQDKRLTPR